MQSKQHCYHCGLPETKCDCENLEPRFCKTCGREFKGKFYFTWAIHQAICSYKRDIASRPQQGDTPNEKSNSSDS